MAEELLNGLPYDRYLFCAVFEHDFRPVVLCFPVCDGGSVQQQQQR